MPDDEVIVTCVVSLPVEEAFTMFTQRVDQWWVRAPHDDPGTVVSFVGDHLVGASVSGASVLASITGWDPPTRLDLAWSGPHAHAGDTVAIEFQSESGATRVTVRHRRPGLRSQDAAAAVVGLWWGDLLTRLARHPAAGGNPTV